MKYNIFCLKWNFEFKINISIQKFWIENQNCSFNMKLWLQKQNYKFKDKNFEVKFKILSLKAIF